MKTIKEYSDVELKALAYDCIAQVDASQNNLKVINDELALRNQQAPEVVKGKK